MDKGCSVPPPPPGNFDCSGAKPILSFQVKWDGAISPIWVRTWNGTIGGNGVQHTDIGRINVGDIVTFMRTAQSIPNDVYFELFNCPAMTSACKIGNSTFHLSCSDSDMNGPEDCDKREGDGKGQIGYINDWIFEGMSGASHGFNCIMMLPPPATECTVPEAPPADCSTAGHPTTLKFRYTPGGCAASNNQQPYGTKFECDEPNGFDSSLPILIGQNDQVGNLRGSQNYTIINDATGLPASSSPVLPGGTFTVSFGGSNFRAESYFTLMNQGGGGTEYVDIHTSCSQPLVVGNVFGSMTLIGFNGQTGGSAINYHYTVTNTGTLDLNNNVFLTDDQLGPIAGPFTLLVGQSMSFDVLGQVSGPSVTNVATAFAMGQNPPCQAMSAPVTVTVVPNCPVWANAATFSAKQLRRSISNTGATRVTMTGMTLSWPASNGKLTKVKFDGDVAWSTDLLLAFTLSR